MSSFLQIPRELRDLIVTEVLTSSITVSQEDAEIPPTTIFPSKPLHQAYTAYGLLHTNQQLQIEVIEALARIRPRADFKLDVVVPDDAQKRVVALRPSSHCVPKRFDQLEEINLTLHLAIEKTYEANVRMLGYLVYYGASRMFNLHHQLIQTFQQAARIPCVNIIIVPSCEFLAQVHSEPVAFDDFMAVGEPPWAFYYMNVVMGASEKYGMHPDRFSSVRKDMIAAVMGPCMSGMLGDKSERVRIWVEDGANGKWEVGNRDH
jgi:hypothetical protein